MKPTDNHPEEVPETPDFPVVKPGGGGGKGRNTIEDRVGLAVRPAKATNADARSTYRDLHTV